MTDRPPESRGADKDQIKPFHAKEVTTGQEAADVVAAVLKHAAARDEAAKKKVGPKAQPVWMLPLGLTTAVLATFLLIAPPAFVELNPIAAQSPEDLVTLRANTMWRAMNQIATYQAVNGRLPASLADANAPTEDLDYTPTGDTYVLFTVVGDRTVTFNSAADNPHEWAARQGIGNLASRIGG